MIDATAAHDLSEQLRRVEERLERLLTSGWRQARSEAVDLRQDADALAEAGLPELGVRVAAVAEANDAGEALQAIALATSACRLLRLRLPAGGVPEGWAPLARPSPKATSSTDTLVPVARVLLDRREVWACARPPRGQWLLLEPPFPAEEPASPVAPSPAAAGIFGRLRRQIDRVRGAESAPAAPWMHHLVRGQLVWRARYPLGATGDVDFYRMDRPAWVTEPDTERYGIQAFHQTLAARILVSGAPIFPSGGGFRLVELSRDDPAAYVWLDPSAADVFGAAPYEKAWSIAWTEAGAVVPVALIARGDPPRLTHLIPGASQDVLTTG